MRKDRKIIGICGSSLFNQQPIQFINQLREESSKYGYYVTALSCNTNTVENTVDSVADAQLINLIRHIPLCGMIVLTETINNPDLLEHIINTCKKKQIPVFSIDGTLDGCYNMPYDNSYGFEQIVRHVVEFHGCRKVNMLAGFRNNAISNKRIAAYKKVLAENNIPVEEERIAYGDFWERPARQAIRNFLNSSLPLPEAIICANDAMAITACSELLNFGYNVPEDIIVTGFDGILSGQYHFPIITTCQPDFKDAASFILQEIENFVKTKHFVPHDHDIAYIPQINQSCGCVPKTIHNINHVISTLYANNGDSAWHNIAMNQLITSNLYNDSIIELTRLLPQHLHLWKNQFRFACVKSSMLSSSKIENDFTDMVSILNLRSGEFTAVGETFPIEDFLPDIDELQNMDVLIIKLLNSGEKVYGYCIEGFNDIDERAMQRCNDFAFFLSYCLNCITHNMKQQELTNGLIKANEEISMLALYDSMTKLYNRQGFYKKINPILAKEQLLGKYLYIFSIDMNRLKYINDTFGHAEGDFAISTLAAAIASTIGKDAIAARFGGDEFVVAIISEQKDAYSSKEFEHQLFDNIRSAEKVADKPYSIEASVGMQCLPIDAHINLESMIAAADNEMYIMKRNSKR